MAFEFQHFASRPRVLDGGWATELQKRGLLTGSCPDLWGAQHPDAVLEVARSFVEAGADAILTNSFRTNRLALRDLGAADRVAELAEQAALLSRRAAGGKAAVFGSIGPSGYLVMTHQVPRERLWAAYAEAAEALQWGGVDGLVLETFSELEELRIALQACRRSTDLPVVVCMSFDAGADRFYTQLGVKPQDLAAMAEKFGADAVGANCGTGPDDAVAVAAILRQHTRLPVWIKANAGLPTTGIDGRLSYPAGYREFAACAEQLLDLGVTFIGGCCGAGPACIQAIRDVVGPREA